MLRKGLAVLVVVMSSGCPQPGSGGTGGGDAAGGGAGGNGGAAFAQSAKANVRFKRSVRLTNDFAAALGLSADALCKELGQYPCTTFVHSITLGGTDPYGVGLYEPLSFTGLATPIVADRVALNGCINRVSIDLGAGSSALIYKGIAIDSTGKLDIESQPVRDALETLYKRALLRRPTEAEIGHLKKLYAAIVAEQKPDPGQAWMQLSCFAVLTTTEALFY